MYYMGVNPKNRGTVPQNGWFIYKGKLKSPIKMDDLGGLGGPPLLLVQHP